MEDRHILGLQTLSIISPTRSVTSGQAGHALTSQPCGGFSHTLGQLVDGTQVPGLFLDTTDKSPHGNNQGRPPQSQGLLPCFLPGPSWRTTRRGHPPSPHTVGIPAGSSPRHWGPPCRHGMCHPDRQGQVTRQGKRGAPTGHHQAPMQPGQTRSPIWLQSPLQSLRSCSFYTEFSQVGRLTERGPWSRLWSLTQRWGSVIKGLERLKGIKLCSHWQHQDAPSGCLSNLHER